ncbi:pyridoxal-phosphate dependent enzyme [Candidatus Bathyarchaeota archaeon]|nr:pyridoxal-phosphate dependent enzyme [Candidatus Bathyarchaeota archaeon]
MESGLIFKCVNGHEFLMSDFQDINPLYQCPDCEHSSLFLECDPMPRESNLFLERHSFWEYMEGLIPSHLIKNQISLGEGDTPLIRSRSANGIRGGDVYFKDEAINPTNSYRDRAAALLVSHALSCGSKTLFSASDGNMGASIAAYAAGTTLSCKIYSARGMDVGKKSQILAFGAILLEKHSDMNEAIRRCLKEQIMEDGYQATAELNPFSMLAQNTIAFEVIASGMVPEEVYVPTGNGGTLFSIWQGFQILKEIGSIDKVPRMIAARITEKSPTKIIPLKESTEYSQRDLLEHAIGESGGIMIDVTEHEISEAISKLARTEGLFVEPASAAAFAAMEKHGPGKTSLIILTGSGLKAPIVIETIANKDNFYTASKFQKKMNLRIRILEQLDNIGDSGLHGYGIYRNLKNYCSKQAVYQHLKKLEEKAFIVNYELDESGRKLYNITKQGKEVLALLKKLIELL